MQFLFKWLLLQFIYQHLRQFAVFSLMSPFRLQVGISRPTGSLEGRISTLINFGIDPDLDHLMTYLLLNIQTCTYAPLLRPTDFHSLLQLEGFATYTWTAWELG